VFFGLPQNRQIQQKQTKTIKIKDIII